MEAYLYEEMFKLEQDHWWFSAKHQIVVSTLARFMPQRDGQRARIADIGCGCGRMLELLGKSYDAVGVDASPIAVQFSRQRGVQIVEGMLPSPIGLPECSFDAVTMLDVLEHLDDDVACARAAASLLKSDGVFVLTVPAYQWLFGPHDVVHHHRRRYRRGQLQRVLEQAGLRVQYISYFNTVLFPLAAAQRVVQRVHKSDKAPATVVPAAPVNALFRGIFASERHLIGRMSLPFGLSIAAVAKRA